ncbi:RsmF rRNA methyltransferase first C-terminal domain-containing protein [Alkalitalea saponilacus]|uniref:NOL1/NOP2/sun family putative RNA methylase n=1 Tax=Alkalitalea saponilacus TaxID=889453 RepID=A0A1T5CCF9_9BACT|nr:RsmF rRNA methyltransferase first C-terminal domain-containing protein [Alkalitalea saponilacus]ASB49816.1 RNA methyltransferase [Alkalitalea saponilacus]SKB57242.1 NOL1/NOP2/sun family putative RNA methylase [Alkalitalea saponilacus]
MNSRFPTDFIQRIQQQFGDASTDFLKALSNDVVTSVRYNPSKLQSLSDVAAEPVSWCKDGVYLSQKPIFTLDPLFHAGCYYPQEASSMILDWILRSHTELPENPIILDLCGAPGGKSTLIANFLAGKGVLVANEVIKSRANILAENLMKWGYSNCVVTRNDPSDFGRLPSHFDVMVVDAPCSGEGMFRKDERAIEEWSESNAAMCASRQRRILTDAWATLKPGGYLIYSTCTFNPAENEENIQWLLEGNKAEIIPLNAPNNWCISSLGIGNGNALAFYPHKSKGEGLFVALLRKRGEESAKEVNLKKTKSKEKSKTPAVVANCIKDSKNFYFAEDSNGWRAFPNQFVNDLLFYLRNLSVVRYGVEVGQIIKGRFQPAHELALSVDINPEAFNICNLSHGEALKYLKGEILQPPSEMEKGYVLISYHGSPLGFAKNIGTRMNNLYPTSLRIRMALPE